MVAPAIADCVQPDLTPLSRQPEGWPGLSPRPRGREMILRGLGKEQSTRHAMTAVAESISPQHP